MKKFGYKFTTITIIVLIAGLCAAAVCLALNVKRFIDLCAAEIQVPKDYATTCLSAVIGLAGIVVIIPVLCSSAYEIDDKNLTVRTGFIKSKIKIKEITRVTLFRCTKKLVVYYGTATDYIAINIDEKDFDAFVDALKEKNSKIFYALDSENDGEH